jgi:hypothetical protein
MAIAYKPAQVQGTSSTGTYATLYETPALTEAIISTIVICNTAASTATYRIGLDDTAGTPGASEWLVYDASVSANDTVALTLGVALDSGRFIRVSSSANTVTFSAFVSEIS